MKEAIAVEQFLNTSPLEKRALISDKKPNSCVAAGELADEYELARSQESQPQVKRQPSEATKKWCGYCKTSGHEKGECRKLRARQERDVPSGSTNKEPSG